ncbi:outer membrane protein assembly factor BamB family protein [Haliovirga abyssi]|uniref:Fibronectin type-III domain-containing protein n=1 Tax=Haliovirga abyssi TaxID=2996794 RepID=A0AAU9DDY6_9FUSO|nr:PQQ-binding-like beta-propeller repeat protein [Haliovirga abyssi]BDU51565.1 hypothetical protein HLVA_21340 [Haliovirga abyssi]
MKRKILWKSLFMFLGLMLLAVGCFEKPVEEAVTLSPPTNLQVVQKDETFIQFSWRGVSGAEGYKIYKSSTSYGTFVQIGNSPVVVYRDEELNPGTTYYYRVKAYKGTVESQFSQVLQATTSEKPKIINITPAKDSTGVSINTKVVITFDKDMDSGTLTSNNVYLMKSVGLETITSAITYNNKILTLTPSSPLNYNTEYTILISYKVKDINGNGVESTLSSFTTEQETVVNTAPTAPTNPTPANNAIDITTNSAITWQASTDSDGDAITYDIYLDETTSPAIKVASDLSVVTYSPTLGVGKTYYWKVVAKDGKGGETSSEIWKFTTISQTVTYNVGDKVWEFNSGTAMYSSPATGNNGVIYIGSNDDNLYAINQDGTEKWECKLDYDAGTPAVGSDGTIYGGSKKETLYAIDPTDGTKKWSFTEGGGFINSAPAIGKDGTIYFGTSGNILYAINPNGTKKWSFTVDNNIQISPVIAYDGTIYVGSSSGTIYAVDSDGTKKWEFTENGSSVNGLAIGTDGIVYVIAIKNIYAINPDGTKKWEYEISSSTTTPTQLVIGSDDTLYFGAQILESDWVNKIFAVDKNGSKLWEKTIDEDIQNGPALGDNGNIYYITYGKLEVFDTNGTKKWEFDAEDGMYGNDSSPLILNNRVYFGTSKGKLCAIYDNVGGVADSPWPMVGHDTYHTGVTHLETITPSNTPPTAPTNPTPINNAVDVSTAIVLEWDRSSDSDGDTVTYDVYLDETTNPITKVAKDLSTYYLGISLDNGKTYYWKVVAKDGKGGETSSEIWKFTTINSTISKVETPTASQTGGEVAVGTKVSLSCSTTGTAIYYTLDGTDPTKSDTEYIGEITIDSDITIKAFATKDGMTDSDILTVSYTVTAATSDGDSFADAIPLNVEETIANYLGAESDGVTDSKDWYKVTLSSPGALTITVTGTTRIDVYDSNNTYQGGVSEAENPTYTNNFTAGTYYFQLSSSQVGAYEISATFVAGGTFANEEDPTGDYDSSSNTSRNDTFETAYGLGLGTENSKKGYLKYRNDKWKEDTSDWYKVTLSSPGALTITVTGTTRIDIYDSNDTYQGGVSEAANPTYTNNFTAGTYYFQLSSSQVGAYEIGATFVAGGTFVNEEDPTGDYDSSSNTSRNDTFETAYGLGLGTENSKKGYLEYRNDKWKEDTSDWYKVTLSSPGALTITVTGTTRIDIYDSNDTYQGGVSEAANPTYTNNFTTGTYYFQLSSSQVGVYEIGATFVAGGTFANEEDPTGDYDSSSNTSRNDTFETAYGLGLGIENSKKGYLEYRNDKWKEDTSDWYKVTLSSPGELTITVTGTTRIDVYDSNDTYQGGVSEAANPTYTENLTAGTYYFQLSSSQVGAYEISAELPIFKAVNDPTTLNSNMESIGLSSDGLDTYMFFRNSDLEYNVPNVYVTKKSGDSDWTLLGTNPVGTAYTGTYSSLEMTVYNNIPYIAYSDDEYGQKCSVKKYDNGSWSYVGTAGFAEAADSAYRGMVIDSNDKIYVTVDLSSGLTVYEYDGSSWTKGDYLSTEATSSTKLKLVNNIPYIIYEDNAAYGSTTQKIVIKKRGTAGWENVMEITGTGDIRNNYLDFVVLNDDIYISYYSKDDDKLYIKKYSSGNLSDITGNLTAYQYAQGIGMAIYENTVFLALSESATSGKSLAFYKYVNDTWTKVGDSFNENSTIYNIKLKSNENSMECSLVTSDKNIKVYKY